MNINTKKAASTLLMIFELVVVIMVVATTFQIAARFAQKEGIAMINIAEDMAMMINTLVALPGDAVVEYPEDLSAFSLLLKNDAILVKAATEDIGTEQRTLRAPASFALLGITEKERRVCLQKTGRTIDLAPCPSETS